mgnify:CR=1 FL=1
MTLELLQQYLYKVYSKDTCYPLCRDDWNDSNPTLGHCAIVSLIVNDYFGGDIYKIKVDGVSHYFNLIDNKVVDLTSSQFNKEIDYNGKIKKDRLEILQKDTLSRYKLLKMRLQLIIEDEDIHNCNLCNDMIEKFPNNKTVSIGRRNDIVILGEAPANNGWRKSGIAWYDVNHKLLPSGVVLQKLLDEINLKIEDTFFLEAIKCYPKDRKYLNKCSENCKKYLFKQLEIIKPKIVLSLGDAATKSILGFKYKKFSDVVGKAFYSITNFKFSTIIKYLIFCAFSFIMYIFFNNFINNFIKSSIIFQSRS